MNKSSSAYEDINTNPYSQVKNDFKNSLPCRLQYLSMAGLARNPLLSPNFFLQQ